MCKFINTIHIEHLFDAWTDKKYDTIEYVVSHVLLVGSTHSPQLRSLFISLTIVILVCFFVDHRCAIIFRYSSHALARFFSRKSFIRYFAFVTIDIFLCSGNFNKNYIFAKRRRRQWTIMLQLQLMPSFRLLSVICVIWTTTVTREKRENSLNLCYLIIIIWILGIPILKGTSKRASERPRWSSTTKKK